MKTSKVGIELIKYYEGFRSNAYKPVKTEKYFTIGYGHYGADVSPNMTITREQGEDLLKKDLERFEKKVSKYDSTYHWTQNQFDALVSFAYNIGSIDQLTANGTRSIEEISNKIPEYIKAGGKTLAGLVARRAKENALFDSVPDVKAASTPKTYPTLRLGSKGEIVKELQQKLNKHGHHLVVDGMYGHNTHIAVISFQGVKGLIKDGIVGPKTWEELNK